MPPSPTTSPSLADDRLWDFAYRSRLRPLVVFHLDRRPDGRHIAQARALLQSLPTDRAGYYGAAIDGRGGPEMAPALRQWRRIGSIDLR